jgi:hypothetical protein
VHPAQTSPGPAFCSMLRAVEFGMFVTVAVHAVLAVLVAIASRGVRT